jgi:hypothetical protein
MQARDASTRSAARALLRPRNLSEARPCHPHVSRVGHGAPVTMTMVVVGVLVLVLVVMTTVARIAVDVVDVNVNEAAGCKRMG